MKRSFLYLLGLTLLALLALWALEFQYGSSEGPVVNALLLPELSERINDVDRVEIVTAGNQLVATLVRSNDSWQIEQLDGYRANWPALQSLLADLAMARVVETKTDKPEYYALLAVEDVAATDAGSVLVKLASGDQSTAILIGKQSQGRTGQFVRLQSSTASVLIDRRLDVSTRQLDWADRTIVDIGSSEVAEVEIIHPSGESLLAMRISADQTDFDLVDLPPGRELKSSWAVNSLGSVFSMLNFETVRPVSDMGWNKAVKLRLLMFSGVEILADMLESGDEHLLRLSASHPAAQVLDRHELEERAAEEIAKIVADINRRTDGWVYGISKQKFDAMVKRKEDLLKPLDSDE